MKSFLALLRSGIRSEIDFGINLDKIDWEKVNELAIMHNVLPLVFDGCELYYEKCGLKIPLEIKLQWYAASNSAELHYAEHLNAIKTLCNYLDDHGFRTMVMKGYGYSLCYPNPTHRPCSDIDIYQFGKFREADALLEKEAAVKIDRTHHHHTVFKWNGVSVENHYDFVNQYTHKSHKLFEQHLKRLAAEEMPLSENGVLLPSPDLAVLFGLIHTASEFAAGAISIRQLCDWWLLGRKYDGKIDWQMVASVCKETGFDKFLAVWNELAEFVFENELDCCTLSEDAQRVLDDILDNKFAVGRPVKTVELMWWKIRRWWSSRWKMQLVYSKENLFTGFFIHLYSHLLKPEKLINN